VRDRSPACASERAIGADPACTEYGLRHFPQSLAYYAGEVINVPMIIRVECYSGYRGEETPRRFFIDGRRVEIEAVMDRWLAPDHAYFKLRGADGATYILRHEQATDRWELWMYDKGTDE